MLKNIKSVFLLKKIISYIDIKRKLNIMRYNINLQNKVDINIKHYKIYSGKYIIFETNKTVKIYNALNDKLIYDGEIINGKKNGKGKEYDDFGNLIFEGEYINGLKNGKFKEYFNNRDNRLKFEGEYFNNKKWNGKEYDGKGNIISELKDGKGFIKEYNIEQNTIKFEGEYINGERHGKEYDINNNIIFEGEYLNEKRLNGKIKDYYNGKLLFEGYSPSKLLIPKS